MFGPKNTALDVAVLIEDGLLNGTIVLHKEELPRRSKPAVETVVKVSRSRVLVWAIQLSFALSFSFLWWLGSVGPLTGSAAIEARQGSRARRDHVVAPQGHYDTSASPAAESPGYLSELADFLHSLPGTLIALAVLFFLFHDVANAISNFAERHRGRAIKQLQTDD